MAKGSGLGDNLYVGGRDVSGDIGSIERISGGPKPWDVTGIDKSAHERLGLLRDGGMAFTSFFNPTKAHLQFSALPTADALADYRRGTTLGNPAACCVGKQINYDPKRGKDGSLTCNVEVQANGYGLEWGVQLTAGLRTDTAATNGTGVDFGAASGGFGAQAYLSLSAFTGTDVTVKVQDSADNISFADVVGGGFAQVTGGAPSWQRIATATNLVIRRYVRAVTVTTGGVTSVTFAVMVAVNATAVSF